jgi:uncharacterized protein (DUF1810 family)
MAIIRSGLIHAVLSDPEPPSWPEERPLHRGWEPAGVTDPHELQRFLDAQAHTYDQALQELRAGHKRTHWMWFVFPQVEGLGRSGMAQRYAISGLEEARAYLGHPTLGRRLVESARALTDLDTDDPEAVFGSVDAGKLRSSMTLFARAAPEEPVFQQVLDHYFGGAHDEATTSRL